MRELEKKFSGKDVVLVANRRITPVPSSGFARARPRSRTLTAVHSNLLEDLCYPTEIVGKRQRFRLDGSRLLKVATRQYPCYYPQIPLLVLLNTPVSTLKYPCYYPHTPTLTLTLTLNPNPNT